MTNRPDIDERRNFVAKVVTELRSAIKEELDRSTKTCLNCLHFDEPNELCKRFNARPPARIIATSCKEHEDDIPF